MATPTDPLMSLLGGQPPQQPQQTPMLPQQQGAPQGVLPPTNPVQGPQQPQAPQMSGADLTPLMQQIAQQYQMPAMQGEMNVAQQMGPMTQPTAIPKMGYQPNFQPMDSAGHVLGDIGKALLLGLSATGPGRAVEGAVYGPKVRQYEAGQQQKAQQIEALKSQAGAYGQTGESASRAIGGLGEASYRQGMLGVGQERNRINEERVGAYAQNVQNRLAVAMRGLDLNAIRTGSTVELNKAKTALASAMPGILQERTDLVNKGIDVGAATRTATENVKAQLGIDEKNPLSYWLDQQFGTILTPSAPQVPQGAQPVQGPTPQPKRSTSKSAAPSAQQFQEGQTATGAGGHKIKFTGGKWVDATTGRPI